MRLAASILKSKYDEKKTIELLNDTKIDYIHIDVMDGKFTENKTEMYKYLHLSKKKLRVHLMVSNPFNYISIYSVLNTETISFQFEIDDDITSLIDFIHYRGLKAGLAIKPDTSVKQIEKYLKDLDEVIVMTVEPGKGGQKLLDRTLYKIDILKKLKKEHHFKYQIAVDGGINDETISKVKNADIAYIGSFVCMNEDFDEQIEKINTALKDENNKKVR